MPDSKSYRLFLLFSAITVLLLLNGWLLFTCFRQVSEQEQWISHTYQVIHELDTTLSSVNDAETGARGFLLTNRQDFLEPYHRGGSVACDHFNTVKQLTEDNPTQQLAVTALEPLIKKRLAALDGVVTTFRENGGRLERLDLQFGDGKMLMDQVRDRIEKMKAEERSLLGHRTADADKTKTIFHALLLVTTALTIIVIAVTFFVIGKNQQVASREARLKEREAEEAEQTSQLARTVAGDINLETATSQVLDFFSLHLGALAGRIFIDQQGTLTPVASVGAKIEAGDELVSAGLVANAYKRDRPWIIDEVPERYWQISSSLGSSTPQALVIMPISFQGQPFGVLELAFFKTVAPETVHLLEKMATVLGVGLNAAHARARLQTLLERTQQQSEELQAQQEELRTNNEELEQQARALESQQQALNLKNRELEATQLDLQQKAADLEASSQYKSDFLAKMSHELRTPLNGLLILSTLLIENKEKNLTKQQTQFAKSINTAGNDLLLLINDILDLSKIEARKLTLQQDDFALGALLQSKKMTFTPQAEAKNLELLIDCPEALEALHLHTDRQRLEQILRNFLSNAIKFTESGSVTLKASADDGKGRITLSVIDTGIGIPSSKQAAIFDAFEQADSSVSRKYGGTGLGLTISRELAQLLGGEITVESTEGRGSSFNLDIPLQLGPVAQERRPSAPPVPANLKAPPRPEKAGERAQSEARTRIQKVNPEAKSILIVEDDDAFRSSVVEAVRSYGFEPIEAADGEVALAILQEHAPDAILLDIKLPGISGLGILEMIKQMPHLRHIPVHMISALEYQHSALRMGALGYLTKPVTIEKVRSALGRIENLISKSLKRVLLIEDDDTQSLAVSELISGQDIEVVSAKTGKAAVTAIQDEGFDCIILDLTLPDTSGFDLLEEISRLEVSLPPIVIYTGKDLTDKEENYLRRYSESIIIKGARSPERLLDEVNLFLHRVESLLPVEKRELLTSLRAQEKSFEGKTILVVDDDIRNIFALTSALETRGLQVRAARDGVEALEMVQTHPEIDLVIMDLMMPRMDGYEAMRTIRKLPDKRHSGLPIVALTAKAMKGDHEKSMEAGASDYLPKPVNLDNLMTVLKVWLAPKGFLS